MNGILEFLKTPAGQGLLSAGLGVAANAGRGGTWNAIGRGGLLGLQGYQGAIDSQQQQEQTKMAQEDAKIARDLRMMQMDKARRESATEDQIRSAAQTSFISPESANAQSQGPMPDGSAVPQVAPGFDAAAYMQKLYGIDPIKAISFQQSLEKDSPFVKIDPKDYTKESIGRFATTRKHEELDVVRKKDLGPAGQVIDLYSAQPGQVFNDPNKPFQIGANGMPVANTPFQQYETNKAKAGASRTQVDVNTGQKGFENTLKLRGDFRSEPVYKAHQDVQSAHAQVTQALKQKSPAGDLAGATKIMKILDPGSVVRESELGMAMAANGLLDRVQNYAQNVVNGTKLTPKQRDDFQTLANSLFDESTKSYNAKRREYEGISERHGLNTMDVVGPTGTPAQPATPAAKEFANMPPANQANKGKILRDTQTGKAYRSNGIQWKEDQ